MSLKETIEIKKVLTDIRGLKKSQRLEVLKELINLMDAPKTKIKIKPRLLDLAGVGREVWKGIDPDEYVRKLRNEWR
jgi:hypothetical protein